MRKLAAAVVAIALSSACAKIIGADFDDVSPRPEVTGDGGPESGTGGGEAGVCESAQPIGPPSVGDDPGTTAFVGVTSEVDFGEGTTGGVPDYLSVGFDLDHTCTGHPDAPKCEPAAWTGGDATDGLHGEDNGVGKMLSTQKDVFGTEIVNGSIITKAIAAGTFAPIGMFGVEDWNGFSEDAKVTVKWMVTVATNKAPSPFVPKMDGTDAWPVASEATVMGSGSTTAPAVYASTSGYVNGSKVVAHFDHVIYAFANVYMDIYDITLQADVVFDAASQTRKLENGLLSGYATANSLITLIPRMTADLVGVPLCTNSSTYADTKKFICDVADHPTPSYVPGEPCDGTSFGIRFTTVPVTIGDVVPLPEPAAKCPPAFDPANDTCDKAGAP